MWGKIGPQTISAEKCDKIMYATGIPGTIQNVFLRGVTYICVKGNFFDPFPLTKQCSNI